MVNLNMYGAIKLPHQGRVECTGLSSAETNQMADRLFSSSQDFSETVE